jgi:predicted secreted Zn-dependent protease
MGTIKAAKASVSKKTYAVEGKTLAEIHESLLANQVGGTDAVGDCTTAVKVPSISKFDEEENAKPKDKGMVEWTVTAKAGPQIAITATITLPALKSDKDLSPAAKKEWQRFAKELSAHEDLHVAAGQSVADEIAEELSNMKATGSGKEKADAIKAAVASYVKQYAAAYGGSKVAERVKKAHEALDKKGNTFDLDDSIE